MYKITYNLSRVDVCSPLRLTISPPFGLEQVFSSAKYASNLHNDTIVILYL